MNNNLPEQYTLSQYLDRVGPIGSITRLKVIASLNLGEMSEAAIRVIEKRSERRYWMEKGLTFEQACLIVNNQKK